MDNKNIQNSFKFALLLIIFTPFFELNDIKAAQDNKDNIKQTLVMCSYVTGNSFLCFPRYGLVRLSFEI